MSIHDNDQYQTDDYHEVNAGWFESRRESYLDRRGNKMLNSILDEEIVVLQAFYENKISAEDSAYNITRPISTSPVPSLGTYSDETVAVIKLWHILRDALVQWPPRRTPDLLALLRAIGQQPQHVQIHNGKAVDIETGSRQLTWDTFPYFSMVWNDSLREPGVIVRQAYQGDATSSTLSQREYIRRKDIEARLIANGVLALNEGTVGYVSKTLEKAPDKAIPANEAAAFEQNRLEFQVPAVASLIKYSGVKLYEQVVQKGQDQQRWIRWEHRLEEIADNDSDKPTRTAAKVAHDIMQTIRARA